MRWSHRQMMERARARDRSADGKFLTGVLTTGIYCLPSCPAKKPRPENVRFFEAPSAAEAAGLRPCKRCRPELFYEGRDADLEALTAAIGRLRRDPATVPDVATLAAWAGFGATKLTAACRLHFHAPPGTLIHDARVAAARRLLLAGGGSALDAGFEVGYESASAFHHNFRRRTAMSPAAFRALPESGDFVLALPTVFRIADTLRYVGRDPESPTERVRGRSAVRALTVDGVAVRLEVELAGRSARCRVSSETTLRPEAAAAVHAAAVRWLGLDQDTGPFERRVRRRALWGPLVRRRKGLRIPQTPTVFEAWTWAVLGQQVNLAFAYRLRRALIEACGRPLDPWLARHPTPEEVAALDVEDLTGRQFSGGKARTLIEGARAMASKAIDVEALPLGSAVEAARSLVELHGVGDWTAQYVLMRGCGFADCLPASDVGLLRALESLTGAAERPGADQATTALEPLRPYRSFATFHLWSSLGGPA